MISKPIVTGADVLVAELKSIGVEVIFAITGAGNLAIIDALVTDGSISIVYSHHEQAAVMEAQGYSRISNRIGVALVTTGGGTSNVVTGILSAHLDSVPILLISGNESSFHCMNPHDLRAYGVQGFDSCAVLAPVTKSTKRILHVEEITNVVSESVNIAIQGRKGPAHIDFPMDIQRKQIDPSAIPKNYLENKAAHSSKNSENFESLINAINLAEKPLLYFGNGIRDLNSTQEAKKLIAKLKIPYMVSWSAIDIFPESDELNIGRVGIYGDRHANILLQKSDLIIAMGTRLAIPQTGYDKPDFGRKAEKWVIDIDPAECLKFSGLGWNVVNGDVINALTVLNQQEFLDLDFVNWLQECLRVKRVLPRLEQLGPEPKHLESQIHSGAVIEYLNKELDSDAIVSTDVGAALLTGHYMYEQAGNRRFFTSQGLGEMGFGLPGAIGAHFANPALQVVCLNTDGALMFNLQEMQVVKENKIPLKLFVFNNLGYSMIRISQDNLFDGRLAGSTSNSGISFPKFSDIASTFGFGYCSVQNLEELNKIAGPLKSDQPELIEIFMDPEQKYFPRLATNKLADGSFISPPLEDLDPKIELSLLEELLGYRAHANSYLARGL